MAKHRKTRQEKMLADQRHVLYHLDINTAQETSTRPKKPEINLDISSVSSRPAVKTISYDYVTKDLKKTSIVTAVIILAQIILFISLSRI
jgi:hypothetical protein